MDYDARAFFSSTTSSYRASMIHLFSVRGMFHVWKKKKITQLIHKIINYRSSISTEEEKKTQKTASNGIALTYIIINKVFLLFFSILNGRVSILFYRYINFNYFRTYFSDSRNRPLLPPPLAPSAFLRHVSRLSFFSCRSSVLLFIFRCLLPRECIPDVCCAH